MLKTITGTYDLVPNSSWNDLQTEEIRLVCDTTSAPVVVNLPQISSIVGGTLNVKIYVVDGAGNAATNNITINPGGSNKIGASTSYVINVNNGGAYIQIGSPTNWLLTPNNTIGGGGDGRPYLSFVCKFVTNGDGSVRTITEIENTTGKTFTTSLVGAGQYRFTPSTPYADYNWVTYASTLNALGDAEWIMFDTTGGNNYFDLVQYAGAPPINVDNANVWVEIRIYL
jgi:hypothetical protein